jgi:hypothetical protein
MARRNAQTHAKRARELAVKERRERKLAKKAERRAGIEPTSELDGLEDSDNLEEPDGLDGETSAED